VTINSKLPRESRLVIYSRIENKWQLCNAFVAECCRDVLMKSECAECSAIALEMKAAPSDVQQHPDPTLVTSDVRQRLRELFLFRGVHRIFVRFPCGKCRKRGRDTRDC
jgi:hypothetical protein